MNMKRIFWCVLAMIIFSSYVLMSQTSSSESNTGSLIHVPIKPKEIKDITPPGIEIIEPGGIATRGMKIAGDTLVVKSAELKIRGIAKDSGGVAVVYVNGSEASLKPVEGGCEFASTQLLQFGINRIEISAVDVSKNTSIQTLTVRREVVIAVQEKKIPVEPFKGHQVWAVVIGISEYQNSQITRLRYADKDAEDFYQYLITPLEKGGRGVAPVNIRKLIDKDATKTNIQEAIFDFMKSPLEEDVVIIFFACHGTPDPYRPNVPYLLAYDSDLAKPAATAVNMQDIQVAIRDYIKAKKVIVFADACHSAGISSNVALRGTASVELINDFIAEIANAGGSVLTFSASEAAELSQESQQWGGGHGVFTYYLLEGLRGKADVDADGLVRLGELVDYVNLKVRQDTKSLQHPSSSSSMWDRNLPMSIIVKEK
ncbi:MAG: caspase family protein [Bacteroidota bacterium]